ncbi:hypothetical protein NW754_012435 [Fusarium falciforme]|nr:hypothetical protein NW754_012435 [Fusarium falciforme]
MSSGLENIGANALDATLTQAASGVDHTNREDVNMTDQPDNEDSDASSYDPAAALFDKITQSSGTSGNKRKSPGSKDPTQPDNVKRHKGTRRPAVFYNPLTSASSSSSDIRD